MREGREVVWEGRRESGRERRESEGKKEGGEKGS